MKKVFEDEFSEIQTDMIQICLEYVEEAADKIYIHGSFEEKTITCDFFYKINGEIYERHLLNKIGEIYDVSVERQGMCLDILNDNIKKMIALCNQYNRPMPTEIRLIYDVKRNSVSADYQYEPVFSQYSDKTADNISQEWLAQEKKANNTSKRRCN